MTQRYWIVGGDYADSEFQQITPGTATISGPFADMGQARTEWQRLTFRDRLGAMTRFSIAIEPMVAGQ